MVTSAGRQLSGRGPHLATIATIRPAALLLAIVALAVPAAALAAPTSTLTAGATLLDQPAGQPWALGLDVKATIANPDGSQPSALRRLVVKFPHAAVNSGAFPTCKLHNLEGRKGPDGCPNGARIGSGDSLVMVRPLFDDPLHATLDVFNGERANGGRRVLFLARTTNGLSVQLVFSGVLKKASGRYGYTLDTPIPRIPTVPGVADASVVDFTVHVQARRRVKGRRISFVEAPTSCPKGGLPFFGTFTFADKSTATSASRISCTLTSSPVGG